MKRGNRMLSVLSAAAMGLSMCSASIGSLGTVVAADMTAIELVEDMGMGWNLGNTFDSCNITWLTPSKPSDIETAWGNIETTQAMISAIKNYGFESVRIPVTWYQMTDDSGTINTDYLARVKEVVDYCYAEGMYVIINMHWDDSNSTYGGKNWLGTADSNFDAVNSKYVNMWSQIAKYFADYDNKLVFESNNEPSVSTDTLEKLNQNFVNTVRESGGNNGSRLLLISSPETNLDKACNTSDFQMPEDPANMQAVSIHYYNPTTFTVATSDSTWGYDKEWGSSEDLSELANNFDKMKSAYVSQGIPVILGEYGVLTTETTADAAGGDKDYESIKTFLETVAGTALEEDGISAFLWDAGDSGDMEFFSRKSLAFHDEEIGQIFIDLAGSGYVQPTIDWVETTISETEEGRQVIEVGSATKVKIEITGKPSSSGTGAIGYWDNNANNGKGSWIQDTIFIKYEIDENGTGKIMQTDSEYEEVLNYDYIEIPASAAVSGGLQVMYFYGGWWDAANEAWIDTSSDSWDDSYYPTVEKAYIPGVVTDPTEPTEPTTEPTEPSSETTEPTTEPTETTEGTESEITWGDANNDGTVAVADAVAVSAYVSNAEKNSLSEEGHKNADVHMNGNDLNASDALTIQQYATGMVKELPVSYS